MKSIGRPLALGAGVALLSMGIAVPAAYASDAHLVATDEALAETPAEAQSEMSMASASDMQDVASGALEAGKNELDSACAATEESASSIEPPDASDTPATGESPAESAGASLPFGSDDSSSGTSEAPVFDVDDTIEDGLYEISNDVSGKLLDVSGASSSNSANAQVWDGNSTPAQRWKVSRVDGHYSFTNVASGKVLDVSGGSSDSGANVQQYQWNATKAQLWDFVKAADGRYYLRSCVGDRFLDVSGGSASSGANVQIYEWNGTPAQMWRLTAIKRTLGDGTYSFVSGVNGSQAIDVSGASNSNGAAVQSYASNGTLAQYWNISYDASTGYYEIRSASSGLALDVVDGGTSSGTKVQQYTPNDTFAQRWSIVENADGSLTLLAA